MEVSSSTSYQELKENFKKSKDWKHYHMALSHAEDLQRCFQNSDYQDKHVEIRRNELKESSDFALFRAKFYGGTTALMAGTAVALSVMKKKVGPGLKVAMFVPAAASLYSGVQSMNYGIAANQVKKYNAFDYEKEWLIKEVKSINPALKCTQFDKEQQARQLAEQRSKEFDIEFAKAIEEKKTQLRS